MNSTNRISSRSDIDWNSICKKTRSGNNFRRCGKEVIRLFRRICALAIIICILCGGACGCEKDTGPVGYTQDEERVNKLRYQAEQRKKFAGSELHDYAVDLTRKIFTKLFPDKNIDDYEIDVTKENPTEEETEESDKERIAELFRTGNFTVSVLSKDGVPSFSTDERDLLMKAFAELQFTAVINLSGFWEDDYIIEGEIHTEPRPMY